MREKKHVLGALDLIIKASKWYSVRICIYKEMHSQSVPKVPLFIGPYAARKR